MSNMEEANGVPPTRRIQGVRLATWGFRSFVSRLTSLQLSLGLLKGGLYGGLYRGYIGIMEKKMETTI